MKKSGIAMPKRIYRKSGYPRGSIPYNEREAARLRRDRKENPDKHRVAAMKNYNGWRARLLDYFGRKCTCCGFAGHDFFFNIHHINNDGKAHRNSLRISGKKPTARRYYRAMLEDPDRDSRYTTWCWNCNFGAESNGGICPHQEERMASFALCA